MTLTLVARNPFTGQLGLAMASGSDDCIGGSLAAGTLDAPGGRAGFLVIQGKGDHALRDRIGQAYLAGKTTEDLWQDLVATDSALPLRQVLFATLPDPFFADTGARCQPWAGHRVKEHLMVAGNMLTSESVLTRMEKAYADTVHQPMRFRLLAALRAGVSAGGDLRGHASAGVIVLGDAPFSLRVTASCQPIEDLEAGISAAI